MLVHIMYGPEDLPTISTLNPKPLTNLKRVVPQSLIEVNQALHTIRITPRFRV